MSRQRKPVKREDFVSATDENERVAIDDESGNVDIDDSTLPPVGAQPTPPPPPLKPVALTTASGVRVVVSKTNAAAAAAAAAPPPPLRKVVAKRLQEDDDDDDNEFQVDDEDEEEIDDNDNNDDDDDDEDDEPPRKRGRKAKGKKAAAVVPKVKGKRGRRKLAGPVDYRNTSVVRKELAMLHDDDEDDEDGAAAEFADDDEEAEEVEEDDVPLSEDEFDANAADVGGDGDEDEDDALSADEASDDRRASRAAKRQRRAVEPVRHVPQSSRQRARAFGLGEGELVSLPLSSKSASKEPSEVTQARRAQKTIARMQSERKKNEREEQEVLDKLLVRDTEVPSAVLEGRARLDGRTKAARMLKATGQRQVVVTRPRVGGVVHIESRLAVSLRAARACCSASN
jgi:hypothetical protein